jgi:phosphoribosylformylglycinamidine synthase
MRLDSILFGETQSRIVLSIQPEHLPQLQEMARLVDVPLSVLGTVGGERLALTDDRTGVPEPIFEAPLSELEWAYRGAIGRIMSQ